MLDLKKDLYSRLVISAHKNSLLNKPFKTIHEDFREIKSSKKIVEKTPAENNMINDALTPPEIPILVPETVASKQIMTITPDDDSTKESPKTVSSTPDFVATKDSPGIRFTRPEADKIDEKIDKIINNPHIIEIQVELEVAEQLLKKIKSVDEHNPKIPTIESTIFRLKMLLDQKSYV